jgi:hypothetical protein
MTSKGKTMVTPEAHVGFAGPVHTELGHRARDAALPIASRALALERPGVTKTRANCHFGCRRSTERVKVLHNGTLAFQSRYERKVRGNDCTRFNKNHDEHNYQKPREGPSQMSIVAK